MFAPTPSRARSQSSPQNGKACGIASETTENTEYGPRDRPAHRSFLMWLHPETPFDPDLWGQKWRHFNEEYDGDLKQLSPDPAPRWKKGGETA